LTEKNNQVAVKQKTKNIPKPIKKVRNQQTTVLGVKIDKVGFQQALEISKNLIESPGKHYIVTPNPEIITAASKDAEFRRILNKADLSIPDGMGLVWIAKVLGDNIPKRVTGVDLLEAIAGLAEEHGFTLFLLGGDPNIAEKAAKALINCYPKLKIAGTFAGRAGVEGDQEILKIIGNKQIDILAVAYGPGKQEKWIARNLPRLNVKLAIAVGGALDFISGEKARAPKIVQKIGLEWVFRLMREPWRIKRQLALPVFAFRFFIERLTKGKL
jgi:N-acetylglucosaminyldiphosphoundecaprenol N-acetyl-beta-D-mannosaminyltransferase